MITNNTLNLFKLVPETVILCNKAHPMFTLKKQKMLSINSYQLVNNTAAALRLVLNAKLLSNIAVRGLKNSFKFNMQVPFEITEIL